jgi:hypothetical protein
MKKRFREPPATNPKPAAPVKQAATAGAAKG